MNLLKAFDNKFGEEGFKVGSLSIIEFAERWCGQKLLLWQRVVAKIYAGEELLDEPLPGYKVSEQEWFDAQIAAGRMPRDTLRRVRKHGMKGFKSILLVVGRRGGKSTIIAVCALYTAYKVLSYDNPQEHYGIQENDVIQIAVAATSSTQSERSPFAKISAICETAIAKSLPLARYIDDDGLKNKIVFLKTNHDREVQTELAKRGISKRVATLQIHAYHSNVDSLRGGAIIAAIFDEFAQFQVNQRGLDSAEYFYNSLVPSTIQFGEDGKIFILSTPRGEIGKFWQIFVEAWKGMRESTIALKAPSWICWESEPPERQRQGITLEKMSASEDIDFNWDPLVETFEEAWKRTPAHVKQEWGAEFVGAQEQWLPSIMIEHPDPEKGVIDPRLKHVTQGAIGRYYTCHVDAATKTDAFALSVVHREIDKDVGDKVVVDHAVRWYVAPSIHYEDRPHEFVIRQDGPEPPQIYFKAIENYLKKNILMRFNIQLLTFDQMQSHQMAENLSEFIWEKQLHTMIKIIPFTKPFNTARSNLFETLVLENRFKSYPHEILVEELKGLQKDRLGKVEKGPMTTDDIWDTVSTAAMHALDLPPDVDSGVRDWAFGVDPSFPMIKM